MVAAESLEWEMGSTVVAIAGLESEPGWGRVPGRVNWRRWDRLSLRLSWHVCAGKRGPLQHGLDCFRQVVQMPFQGRREGVHPLRSRDEILQRLCGRDVINPKWNDVNALVNSALYFALDLWRSVRVPRKDQDHNATGFDRIDNRFAPVGTRNNITRRDP